MNIISFAKRLLLPAALLIAMPVSQAAEQILPAPRNWLPSPMC